MAEEPAATRRYAWAKVNLYLEITGRRPDGYHEIESLVVFAGVGDRLDIRLANDLVVDLAGPFAAGLPRSADNLVARAARALADWAHRRPNLRIRLDKQLPAAAGLGGGSADAAAVLEGLCTLWRIRPTPGELEEIALALGADVPVCLFGRPAFVQGIGERISRAPPLPPAWLVLINPGIALATQQVFEARTGDFAPAVPWTGLAVNARELAARLAARRNDLEAPARSLAPEIDEVLGVLDGFEGALLARMSGSGATCFALFADPDSARAAVTWIAAQHPGWWVAAAPLLHGKFTGHWRV